MADSASEIEDEPSQTAFNEETEAETEKFLREIDLIENTKLGALDQQIETAEELERKQTSIVRSVIAVIIIATYSIVILIAVVYVALSLPDCTSIEPDMCGALQAVWKTQSETLIALLTGSVLPVVTLMLGFYFGTETAKKNNE